MRILFIVILSFLIFACKSETKVEIEYLSSDADVTFASSEVDFQADDEKDVTPDSDDDISTVDEQDAEPDETQDEPLDEIQDEIQDELPDETTDEDALVVSLNFNIDSTKDVKEISPYIYGINNRAKEAFWQANNDTG